MTNEERENRKSQLSCDGWITLLNNEITNLELEEHQYSNAFFPLISLFVVAFSAITSTMFSTASASFQQIDKANIFNNLSTAFMILSILFFFFFAYSSYKVIKFCLFVKKDTEKLKVLRNDIIDGLADTTEIRERWRNLIKPNYRVLLLFDFLNLRFSISKK